YLFSIHTPPTVSCTLSLHGALPICTTFIFVTHDQEEALAMSDRIVVMYDGVVQQIGSGEAIYEHPAYRFVAGFIGKQNFIPVTVDRKSTRLNSSHVSISYAVFCLKK